MDLNLDSAARLGCFFLDFGLVSSIFDLDLVLVVCTRTVNLSLYSEPGEGTL